MNRERVFWITVVVGLIIALLTMIKCDGETISTTKTTTRDVPFKIPEIRGEFKEPTNQSELPPKDPDTIRIKGKTIYLQSPLDKELKKEISTLKDSLSIIGVLLDANRRREYSSEFSDKYITIHSKTGVFGKLDKNELSYVINARDTVVKETTIEKTNTIIKTDKFGVLAGGGIKQNLDSKQLNYEVSAGIRVNKLLILGAVNTRKEAGVSAIIEF